MFTTYRAVLFDDHFNPRGELPLAGVPSRVQVAPDGKLAGTTVFVSGHAYSDGSFSTRTSIIDLESGRWLVEDLETFTVRRKGAQISRQISTSGVSPSPATAAPSTRRSARVARRSS